MTGEETMYGDRDDMMMNALIIQADLLSNVMTHRQLTFLDFVIVLEKDGTYTISMNRFNGKTKSNLTYSQLKTHIEAYRREWKQYKEEFNHAVEMAKEEGY